MKLETLISQRVGNGEVELYKGGVSFFSRVNRREGKEECLPIWFIERERWRLRKARGVEETPQIKLEAKSMKNDRENN